MPFVDVNISEEIEKEKATDPEFAKAWEENQRTKLTDEQVDQINQNLESAREENPNLKFIKDLPSNNGVEESQGDENGYSESTTVTVNPNNGVILPTAEKGIQNGSDTSFEQMLKDSEERVKNNVSEKVVITEEDIKDQTKNDELFKELNLSSEDVVMILNATKRYQNKEDFNIYRALPESVQNSIQKYCASAGFGDKSSQSNSVRNSIAEAIIDSFVTNITVNKYAMDFQNEMNEIENQINKEFSKMFIDYTQSREEYVKALVEKVGDESKKALIGDVLDAVHDGFALERIKIAARENRIPKIKRFDIQKPSRSFDSFNGKYMKSTYNIYSIYTACKTLSRHMKDTDENDVILFFVAIAKFCMNYTPENAVEHAFMYYAMYNPLLLDIYKGEDYDKFAEQYIGNVKEIIALLKEGKDFSFPNTIRTQNSKKVQPKKKK